MVGVILLVLRHVISKQTNEVEFKTAQVDDNDTPLGLRRRR